MPLRVVVVGAIVAAVWPAVVRTAPVLSDPVSVVIDVGRPHQRMDGFGATFASVGGGDGLTDELRHRALDALFQQIHVRVGSLDAGLSEASADGVLRNDDDDPQHLEWSGFQTGAADAMARLVLSQPEATDFHDFALGQRINVRFGSPWMMGRHVDHARLADEAAEQVVAGLEYWRDRLKIVPKYIQLFNEPTTGNEELAAGDVRDVVSIVKRTGARLRADGFGSVTFVVPNEETEQASLDTAAAILSDAEARPYVSVIGYHPYPYGSAYASVPRILEGADRGRANGDALADRRKLRKLAAKYRVPLWMTEVSHGDVDVRSFDDLRGRAIEIHDELEYADASAVFGMFAIWVRQRAVSHVSSDSFWSQEGSLVFVDQAASTVAISGIGYAMGHYARWLHPGATRVDVKSSDPLVLASAFRDDATDRQVVVLINNAADTRRVQLSWRDVAIAGPVVGEQSTSEARWAPLASAAEMSPAGLTIDLPSRSVTTLAAAARAAR